MKKQSKQKRIKYDKAYIDNDAFFKDRTCEHESTAVYDGKYKGDVMTDMQMVCIRCGQISEWGKGDKRGVFTCTFTGFVKKPQKRAGK